MSNVLDFVAYREKRIQEKEDEMWIRIFADWAEGGSENAEEFNLTYSFDIDIDD